MPLTLSSESVTPSRPTSASIVTIVTVVKEGETAIYTTQLLGPSGGAILNTDFTAITLTFIDEATHAVINSRNAQDVLGPGKLGLNDHTFSVFFYPILKKNENKYFVSPGCHSILKRRHYPMG